MTNEDPRAAPAAMEPEGRALGLQSPLAPDPLPVPLISLDAAGRMSQLNAAAAELLGRARTELAGAALATFVRAESRPALETHLERCASGGGIVETELLLDLGQETLPVLLRSGAPQAGGLASALIDQRSLRVAEENARALKAALEERTQEADRALAHLRLTAAQLTFAEQRERRRLSQVLHDHLQQLIVAAKLRLSALESRADPELRPTLREVDLLLKECIEASRSLAVELSPPLLYDAGLAAALEWLVRQMREKHGLTVSVRADRAADPEAHDVRTVLFQATREILFNVVKHAAVGRARVALEVLDERRLRLVVADDGVGFDLGRVDPSSPAGSGLAQIKERLGLIGGALELESQPGSGTKISLIAPRGEPVVAQRSSELGAARVAPSRRSDRRLRVLVADDHDLIRKGLRDVLGAYPDLEVVGEAADGQAAVDQVLSLSPDVVVMDVGMPRLSGLEATRRLRAAAPLVRVIGLSTHAHDDMGPAMLDAGASAYLAKDTPSDRLVATIRAGIAASPP